MDDEDEIDADINAVSNLAETLAAELWAVQALLVKAGIVTTEDLRVMALRGRSLQDQERAKLLSQNGESG